MKTNLTLAFVAFMTSSAFAGFQAPLPEFKNEKQLAQWRAEKSAEATSQGYAAEEAAFYTGKPYLASSGGYAFKYRSYNPELARWTSEDPSGFPDGANNSKYVDSPTSEFDFQGLQTVTIAGQKFDFGEIMKTVADTITTPHPVQMDVPGSTVTNSTQDPLTVNYNSSAAFDASAKLFDFGASGKFTGGLSTTGTVQKGWSVKLITHWKIQGTAVIFNKWEVKTFE
jgi:RHS repeat-associated protein